MLSFVIPAHNEEALIEPTLLALRTAAERVGQRAELIVVDDASTDRTAEVARSLGAVVIPVNLRKISAVRNAGARSARGEVLIFVDADTVVSAETLTASLDALRKGAVGGGARVRMDGGVPLWAGALTALITWSFYRLQLAAGCFLFARRDVFEAVGGFDEEYFASEEVHLSRSLKSRGRFVVVGEAVTTSSRKFRLFSARKLLWQLLRLTLAGSSALKRRETLGLWYGGQREHGERRPET